MQKFIGQVLYIDEFNNEVLAKLPRREDYIIANDASHEQIDAVTQTIKSGAPLLFLANYASNYYLNNKPEVLLIGHTSCGTKTAVILQNISIYIDLFCAQHCIEHKQIDIEWLQCGDGIFKTPPFSFINELKATDIDFSGFYEQMNDVRRKSNVVSHEYIIKQIFQVGVGEYYVGVRFYFNKEADARSFAYSAYMCNSILVASYNETTLVEKLGAQYGIYIGAWSMLTNYAKNTCKDYYLTKAKYNFVVDVADYKPAQYSGQIKSLYMYFDIETTNMAETISKSASIISEDNAIFNIGLSMCFECNKNTSLLDIGIINFADGQLHEIAGDAASLTIVTKSHVDNLKVLAYLIAASQPDFLAGYNILGFDIPQILLTLRCNNCFEWFYIMTSMNNSDSPNSYAGKKVIGEHEYLYKINEKNPAQAVYTLWERVFTTPNISGLYSNSSDKPRLRVHKKIKEFKIKPGVNPSYHYIDIPGIILLDVYLISWKKHPNANPRGGKMDFYLKKFGIAQKLDMPYWKIWAIYKATINYDAEALFEGKPLAEQMNFIREYCNYDAHAAKLLIDAYDYMAEKRKYCELVFYPLQSNIYKADTSKVESGLRYTIYSRGFIAIEHKFSKSDKDEYDENGVRKYASSTKLKREILGSNGNLAYFHYTPEDVPRNKGGYCAIHYSGKVTVEYRGRKFIMPVEAEDFASLYPSIEESYNMCPSTIVRAKELLRGRDCHDFTCENFEPYYKNLPVYIKRHNNDKANYGILPLFLANMKIERVKIKAAMAKSAEISDAIMERFRSIYKYSDHKEFYPDDDSKKYIKFCESFLFDNEPDYKAAVINYGNQNQGQNAVKVTMNSTYGYLDYAQSLFYAPIIAMMTTYFGRKYIMMANEICEAHGKVYLYNDTDSVYYRHSVSDFADIFDRFIEGEFNKDALHKKVVRRSIRLGSSRASLTWYYKTKLAAMAGLDDNDARKLKVLARLEDKSDTFEDMLNKEYSAESGSNILKQVREETLYPAVFLMKKKYFGKVHTTNYTGQYGLSNILIRGIAIRSSNCTGFLSKFIEDLFYKIIDGDDVEIKDIVHSALNEAYNIKITADNLHLFEKVGRYKSNKANAVAKIVERIKKLNSQAVNTELKELYKVPAELESVFYIYCVNEKFIDIMGRVYNANKSESAETKEIIAYFGLEVDLHSYINSTLATCAQFLAYDKENELYKDGIKNKDYVLAIKADLEKKCKALKKNSTRTIEKAQFKVAYVEYFKAHIDNIKERIKKAYPTIGHALICMIDIKKTYFEKVRHIANEAIRHYGLTKHFYNCGANTKLLHEYNDKINSYAVYVNDIREYFIDALFINIKAAMANENNAVIAAIPKLGDERVQYLELFLEDLKRYAYTKWLEQFNEVKFIRDGSFIRPL